MDNQKQPKNQVIWIVVIVVVLAISVIGIWAALSNKNGNNNTNKENTNINSTVNINVDTSEWKTYVSTRYSFMYPSNWNLLDSPYSDTPDLEAGSVGFGGNGTSFRIKYRNAGDGICNSLINCVEKHPQYSAEGDKRSNLEKVSIDKNEALYETITRPVDQNWIYHVWYMYRNDEFITIYTGSKVSDDSQTKPIYDAIINSFRFVK